MLTLRVNRFIMMKRLIFLVITLVALCTPARSADNLFPYPVPPEDVTGLGDRCDYLVAHFWDRCNFKSAFSARERLHNAFGDWISFMPYATADTVHAAIDRLLASVQKSGPHTLELARMAEAWTYSDTSMVFSEEIYYPFAKAASEHRKIDKADRARFQSHVQILDNTRTGERVKWLEYELPDGSRHSIDEIRTQMIVVIFNSHDCDACTLARVRISANINATTLIKAGLLTVLSIEPGEAGAEWLAAAPTYPSDWTVGASPEADEYFNLRMSPTIYILDSRHKILAKDITVDGLLNALATLRTNTGM